MPEMELIQPKLFPSYAFTMPLIKIQNPLQKIEGGNLRLLNLILHTTLIERATFRASKSNQYP